MKKNEFYNEIEEILEVDTGCLSGDEKLVELDGWDSLAIVMFIAMIDNKLNTAITAERLLDCVTIDDLAALCEGKIE